MDYADTVGAVGDTLVLKGWVNEANNATVTITEITNTKIKVSGATLVSEQGGKKSRFYKESAKVTQGKTINIGNKTYRVYLMKGAGDDPTDSYSDSDRGAEGPGNMWNSLILPLHEHAKMGNWNYPAYAVGANGDIITSDWNIGLTDENLGHITNMAVVPTLGVKKFKIINVAPGLSVANGASFLSATARGVWTVTTVGAQSWKHSKLGL